MKIPFEVPLPRTKVVLNLVSGNEGRAFNTKIATIFLKLWAAIEGTDRMAIATYWKAKQPRCAPKILFADPWLGHKDSLACGEDHGTVIKCNLPWFRLLTAEVIEAVLAHEIAHVYQSAIGKHRFNLTPDDFSGRIVDDSSGQIFVEMLGPVGRVELHADEIMHRWGFDHLVSRTWMLQYTEPKANQRVLRTKPLLFQKARKTASRDCPLSYCCDMN